LCHDRIVIENAPDRLDAAELAALPREFFARPTLEVAPELLGCVLVTTRRGVITAGRIVEVEAYLDARDQASHAARGKGPTARNAVMYGPPGRAYVYLIYGMHHCFNLVTERDGAAGAVLVRALEPIEGLEAMRRRRGGAADRDLAAGPGKLCAALAIDRRDDARPLDSRRLFVAARVSPPAIVTSPRIGVDYAGEWATKSYRFSVAGSPFVSKPRPALPNPRN
jgi:DNA-3-methyladenine glycosylase